MTRSILSLPPVLQAVWTAAYAAGVTGELSRYRADGESPEPKNETLGEWAEAHAWEAVRRANGGLDPLSPEAKTIDDMRQALLWFADEGHYVGTYRRGAGFVDAVGLSRAREALGLPIERKDGSTPIPLSEALAARGVS